MCSSDLQLQLLVVHDGEPICGFFGLEVKKYPRSKMLVIQYCAMETGTLELIQEDMMTMSEEIAKNAGCVGIEFIGRPGWKQFAEKYSYSVQSVMYQKFL